LTLDRSGSFMDDFPALKMSPSLDFVSSTLLPVRESTANPNIKKRFHTLLIPSSPDQNPPFPNLKTLSLPDRKVAGWSAVKYLSVLISESLMATILFLPPLVVLRVSLINCTLSFRTNPSGPFFGGSSSFTRFLEVFYQFSFFLVFCILPVVNLFNFLCGFIVHDFLPLDALTCSTP